MTLDDLIKHLVEIRDEERDGSVEVRITTPGCREYSVGGVNLVDDTIGRQVYLGTGQEVRR